jgi:methionine-rich copper-binding protein CopC
MNQASGHVQAESQKPQDHKRYKYCPQHLHSSFSDPRQFCRASIGITEPHCSPVKFGVEAAPQLDVSNSDQHLFSI